MPSPHVIPVATIAQLRPHSNADQLEIAEVLGWQCVVQKGRYSVGNKVIYIAPDSLLDKDLSDAWGVTQYLHKGRIKPTRLRGEPSFGLVMPCLSPEWQVGDDVSTHFPGITKYEPPIREQRSSGRSIPNPNALPGNPLFGEYTHIANLRHYPDIFSPKELVVVTEKLHGTNSRIGMVDGEWMAGSHRVRRGESDVLYWSPKPKVEALVTDLAKHHKQVVVYGEILGSDVQSLDYGYQGHAGYRAFDIMVDGRFLDYPTFDNLCLQYDVPIVPYLIGIGWYSFDVVKSFAQGRTTLAGEHMREGVVVRPIIERTDPRVGRVVLKYVSDDYLLAKHSDFAEV